MADLSAPNPLKRDLSPKHHISTSRSPSTTKGTKVDTQVKMVTVTEIMQKATKSDDFRDFDGSPESWFGLIIDKVEGRPSVPLLIREGVKAEDFDPIEILLDNPPENGQTTQTTQTTQTWRIGDGHHRLVTAILLGFDSVPVVHSYGVPANRAHEGEMPNLYIHDDFVNAAFIAAQIGQSELSLLEAEYAEA